MKCGKKMRILLSAAFVSFCLAGVAACGVEQEENDEQSDPVVLEQGVLEQGTDRQPADPATDSDEPFPDRGEATTLADLDAALAQIDSYYFEEKMPYVDGYVYMQVWYKDGKMKVQTSVDGYGQSVSYYDYAAQTVTSVSLDGSDTAVRMAFDPGGEGEDAPDDPKNNVYSECELLGYEVVNRQGTLKVQQPNGNILWVSTKYGFPVQAYFVDSLGYEYTVEYKNVEINNVQDADVEPPADLNVIDYR